MHATISGNVNGQVAIGHGNRLVNKEVSHVPQVTDADIREWSRLLDEIRRELVGTSFEAVEQAQERLAELEDAVTAPRPELSTMEYVRNWFAKTLPRWSAAVTSLVVHPVVVKLVAAAGDELATEFRNRFDQFL